MPWAAISEESTLVQVMAYVPSGTKPSPEPMLTEINDVIFRASPEANELINRHFESFFVPYHIWGEYYQYCGFIVNVWQ